MLLVSSCCTSEIQGRRSDHINLLQDSLVKGKDPKEIVDAVKNLKYLAAFHQGVTVALGTSLQHLADSLFVQLGNFVLQRRDSYLDHVKSRLKQDTWNQLCNAPLFHDGLFSDAVLATAEQDITKFGSASAAQGPGPGAPQYAAKKGSYRFKPYEKKDPQSFAPANNQQLWRQFSSRNKGRGRGGSYIPFSPNRPREVNRVNDSYHVLDPHRQSVLFSL